MDFEKNIFFDRDDQIFLQKIPNRAEITLFDYTHDNKYKKQVKFRIFYLILSNLWNDDLFIFLIILQRFIMLILFYQYLPDFIFSIVFKIRDEFF